MLNRRLFLSSAAAFAVAGACTAFATTRPLFGFDPAQVLGRTRQAQGPIDVSLDLDVRASRVAWLEEHTDELKSIDLNDNKFGDLETFGKAVGDARIVMLGEQSHGDGTTFRAKSRLIRFLHEEMGFDVLAFESGLYNMHKVWERIRAGEDLRQAARRGIFGIWSRSRQVQPLIDYVGERARSRRPLELAGFDCQFSGTSRDRLVDELNAFLAAQGVDTASVGNWPRFCAVLANITEASPSFQWKPSEEERDLVLSTIDILTRRIEHSEGVEVAFWRQLFRSTKAQTWLQFQLDPKNISLAHISVRDAAMADNLIWLAREAFPRRKIIVWAATFHNMRNPHLVDTGEPTWSYSSLTTMGHLVWQALGDAIYNVGFTAYEGFHGSFNRTADAPVAPPSPDSLEGLWGETKHDNAFLDLRRIRGGGEWLKAPLVSRPIGYSPMTADWTKVLDAMVFTRTMRPSTLAE